MMKKKLNLLITCASNKAHIVEYVKNILNRFNAKSTIFTADKNNKSIIKNFDYNYIKMPDLLNVNKKKILSICKKKKN